MNENYYKIIGRNFGNYPYKIGLNTLKENGENFDPSPFCCKGGLYFTDKANIHHFYSYGDKLCILTIPENAKVVLVGTNTAAAGTTAGTTTSGTGKDIPVKWKADQIYIHKILPLNLDTILKYELKMVSMDYACYVDILEWWKMTGIGKYTYKAMDTALNTAVLDWWFESGLCLKYTQDAMNKTNNIDILNWWKNKKDDLLLKYNENVVFYLTQGYFFDDKYKFDQNIKVLDWWLNSGLILSNDMLYDSLSLLRRM